MKFHNCNKAIEYVGGYTDVLTLILFVIHIISLRHYDVQGYGFECNIYQHVKNRAYSAISKIRMYLLRGYILGVLTHKTAWD